MPRYYPLNSFVVGGGPTSFIVSVPAQRTSAITKTMPTFNEKTTGLDVVKAFPERVKGKTCMLFQSLSHSEYFLLIWIPRQ